jgi:predicted Zn finger-like uncharacterized protein
MLATRCPLCNTLFKVSSGQLQLHQGEVRCGHCQHVFSGIDHLTPADADAWENLQLDTSIPQEATPAPFLPQEEVRTSVWSQCKTFWQQTPNPLRITMLGLLGFLFIQNLWWSRVSVIQVLGPPTFSDTSSWLSRTFSVPPTSALVLEGSGLQALDENTLRIDLTLRNQHRLPSQWPHLKIDLLDSQGLLLATKTVPPNGYQMRNSQPADQQAPIAPGQTIEALAYLNIKALGAQLPDNAITGFRLELFDRSTETH